MLYQPVVSASCILDVFARSTTLPYRNCPGLGPNLAYFVLRFGAGAMLEPDAPVVFDRGVAASLQEQCAAQIDAAALRAAGLVLEEESQPVRSQRREITRSQPIQGDRSGAREQVEPSLAQFCVWQVNSMRRVSIIWSFFCAFCSSPSFLFAFKVGSKSEFFFCSWN